MKNSKLFVRLILIALIVICGVNSSSWAAPKGGGGDDLAGYFPLKVGYHWEYDSDVNESQKIVLSFKVTGMEKVNGVDCYIYEGFSGGKSSQKEYYELNKKALICHRRVVNTSLTADLIPPEPMLEYPLTLGKTWKWEGKITKDVSGTFNFTVAGEEELTTPAGKFETIKISMDGSASDGSAVKSTRWFAPGVGMVKEVSELDTFKITATLKSYKLEK
jgi:hypothetical protein